MLRQVGGVAILIATTILVLSRRRTFLFKSRRVVDINSRIVINDKSNNDANNTSMEFLGIVPRSFNWTKGREIPCFEPFDDWTTRVTDPPMQSGFVYMKNSKTGGSTMSGLSLRIARNVAKRRRRRMNNKKENNFTYPICRVSANHGWANDKCPNRDKENSFLWTNLRDPTSRTVSAFFHFLVSRRGIEPTDDNFLRFANTSQLRRRLPAYNEYLLPTWIKHKHDKQQQMNPIDAANRIILDYDFIGVTERMDESSIALMMMLDLPMSDMLYLNSKSHGGYDDGRGANGCAYLQKSFISSGMTEYFNSNIWKDKIMYEVALHQAANRSLDMTIDQLGRAEFEQNLELYRHALDVAQKRCSKDVKMPCDSQGHKIPPEETDCINNDLGCGMECLDEVAADLNLTINGIMSERL